MFWLSLVGSINYKSCFIDYVKVVLDISVPLVKSSLQLLDQEDDSEVNSIVKSCVPPSLTGSRDAGVLVLIPC